MPRESDPQALAIARFATIAPLVTRSLSPAEAAQATRAILARTRPGPLGTLECVSRRTLTRWITAYKDALPCGTVAALAALAPKGRSDKGQPRVFSEETLQEAIRLRQELATRSTANLLAHLDEPPLEATLAYHLRQRGVTRRDIAKSGRAYPRYEAKAPNTTWQSDITEGFWLPDPTDPTRRKEVHLFGFIDDHSRLVTHGEWYFKETLPCLFDCLKKAVIKHGVPATLYWDNGPVYRAKQVELLAARLGIEIVFSTPYHSEGRGKVERFWQTVAGGFMKEAAHADLQTLPQLNQHFWAWLEGYHLRPHGSTRQPPRERWQAGAAAIRRPHPVDLAEAFLWEETRQVKKTGTFALAGNEYRVADALVGQQIAVRYDPLDLATVRVYRDDTFVEIAAPYRLTAHTHQKATPKPQDALYLPLPSSKRLLATRAAARQQDIATDLAALGSPPDPTDRLTRHTWSRLLEEVLGRAPLPDPDREAADQFFHRHAPLQQAPVNRLLEGLVARHGAERHMAFYLDEVRLALVGGRA